MWSIIFSEENNERLIQEKWMILSKKYWESIDQITIDPKRIYLCDDCLKNKDEFIIFSWENNEFFAQYVNFGTFSALKNFIPL